MMTAEEFLRTTSMLDDRYDKSKISRSFMIKQAQDRMIEFAKMHVQKALEAEKQRIRINSKGFIDTTKEEEEIDKVYPLTNIK